MGRRDYYHDALRCALEKDGWTITHDPFPLPYGSTVVEIDLGAERLIAAEKGNERIAVELKSFTSASIISEFHTALGQYLNYKLALRELDEQRVLYLAIPESIEESFFRQELPLKVLDEFHINVLVFNPHREEVTVWKN
jgi:hypothetical protein